MKKTIFAAAVLFSAAAVFLYWPTLTFAATDVQDGDITQDTVWTKEKSPYIVRNHVNVRAGAILTIKPGVIIKFDNLFPDNSIYFSVYGKVVAEGTSADKIYLTSFKDDSVGGDDNQDGTSSQPSNGPLNDWGIWIYSPGTIFNNVVMKYSNGIGLDSVSADLDDLEIHDSNSGIFGDNVNQTVDNFKASNIYYNALEFSDGDLELKNSRITDTLYGSGVLITGGDLRLEGSSIANIGVGTGTPDISMGINAVSAIDSAVSLASSTLKDGRGAGIQLKTENPASVLKASHIQSSTIMDFKEWGIDNQTATVTDASHDWWGDPSGPYNLTFNSTGTANKVSDNVIFSPWLLSDPFHAEPPLPPAATGSSNVVFLPGIEASRLYKKGLTGEDQLWEPNWSRDVTDLYLNSLGQSLDPTIYTRDIIKRSNITGGLFDQNVYKSFTDSMDQLTKEGLINSWEPLPYDWRKDLDDIIDNGIKLQDRTLYPIAEIERMAASSKTGKVTLITHSNGGLFAKRLIEKLTEKGKNNLIDKLIMVAPPEAGTPQSIGGLLHGDEQDIKAAGLPILLNNQTARGLGENMPGAYNLLPSARYFHEVQTPVVEFDSSVDQVNNFRKTYGNDIRSASSLSDFLLASKDKRPKPASSDLASPNVLNPALTTQAANIHNLIDNFSKPPAISVTEIAGWGLPTTRGLRYSGKEDCILGIINCRYILDRKLLKTVDGDGTVVSPSILNGGDKVYLNLFDYNRENQTNLDHASILEAGPLESYLKNIITGKNNILPINMLPIKPAPADSSHHEITVHSPVSLEAYDRSGRHTGLAKNPDPTSDLDVIEETIPNSSYEEVGETKNLELGEDSYSIKITGLAVGSFTLDLSRYVGEGTSSEFHWANVPTTPLMSATISITPNSTAIPNLAIDVDGDGGIDAYLSAAANIDAGTFLFLMKKTVSALGLEKKIETKLLSKIDDVVKLLSKGKIKDVEKKIRSFSDSVKMKTQKDKYPRSKKISDEDRNTLINLLDQLLELMKSNV